MQEGNNAAVIYRRIGNTTYKVRVHLSDTDRETMEDKIIRLIREEALDKTENCGIIGQCRLVKRAQSKKPKLSLD